MDILSSTGSEAFFHGFHHIRREHDGWMPLRFPEEQIERLLQVNEVWYPRTLCPAGIRISFLTDSPDFSLGFRIIQRIRDVGGPELHIDGSFVETREIHGSGSGRLSFEIPQSSGIDRQHLVELHLPWSIAMVLQDLDIEDARPVRPPAAGYVALGDSITQGVFSTRPSCSYPLILARSLGLDLCNRGVGGHIFEADSLDDSIGQPALVTIAYGTNDWAQCVSSAAFRNRISAYLKRLSAITGDTDCYVITPLWREQENRPNDSGVHLGEFRDIIREVCEEQDVSCVDGAGLIPHSPSFFADHVHPNDEGFRVMAERLLEKIGSRRM